MNQPDPNVWQQFLNNIKENKKSEEPSLDAEVHPVGAPAAEPQDEPKPMDANVLWYVTWFARPKYGVKCQRQCGDLKHARREYKRRLLERDENLVQLRVERHTEVDKSNHQVTEDATEFTYTNRVSRYWTVKYYDAWYNWPEFKDRYSHRIAKSKVKRA